MRLNHANLARTSKAAADIEAAVFKSEAMLKSIKTGSTRGS